MLNFFKNYFSKENIFKNLKQLFLLILGTVILSVGCGFFLIPFQIVSGGITGITILFSSFIAPDILSYILSWSLFIIGFIFLGPKFTISSLISTIFYPVFISLITRTGILNTYLSVILGTDEFVLADGVITNLESLKSSGFIDTGLLLIIGLLGGMCVGIGCAITFHGGGSTGGIDILSLIISKYCNIKESIPFFLTDATIVVVGIIVHIVAKQTILVVGGLVGILSALICSMMVEIVYSGQTSAYMVDVISDKYQEIVDYACHELDRGATVFDVVGGYTNQNKKMVRINFQRREYSKVRSAIAKIDPKAFCSFSSTMFVGGEGFGDLKHQNPSTFKLLKEKKAKKEKEKNG